MEEPSKCDILFTKRDLQTLCLAGVRKISKLYEKSAIKKEHCTNCVRIGQGAQLTTTVMIHSHCFYFNKQSYALELLYEKEKAIIIR